MIPPIQRDRIWSETNETPKRQNKTKALSGETKLIYPFLLIGMITFILVCVAKLEFHQTNWCGCKCGNNMWFFKHTFSCRKKWLVQHSQTQHSKAPCQMASLSIFSLNKWRSMPLLNHHSNLLLMFLFAKSFRTPNSEHTARKNMNNLPCLCQVSIQNKLLKPWQSLLKSITSRLCDAVCIIFWTTDWLAR